MPIVTPTGAQLRRRCPVIASLTKGATLRDVEAELKAHMSRNDARALIMKAKAAGASGFGAYAR